MKKVFLVVASNMRGDLMRLFPLILFLPLLSATTGWCTDVTCSPLFVQGQALWGPTYNPLGSSFVALGTALRPRTSVARFDGRPRFSGYYVFPAQGGPIWVPDSGAPVVARGGITGHATHLEILRQSTTPERFAEILAIQNPRRREQAARAELDRARDKALSLRSLDEQKAVLDQRLEDLASEIASIPLDRAIPQQLVDRAYILLADFGLWAPSIEKYLEEQESQLAPVFREVLREERGQWYGGLNFITARVRVITGSVPSWYAGGEDQTTEIEVMHRRAPPEEADNDLARVTGHSDLFDYLRWIFGEDRVLYDRGLGASSSYGGLFRMNLASSSPERRQSHSTGNYFLNVEPARTERRELALVRDDYVWGSEPDVHLKMPNWLFRLVHINR